MVDVRRFLHQLRPAGAPGAAAGAAVPVDRRMALEAELAPVFAALVGTESECERIRSEAAEESAGLAAAAAAFAARTEADAESEAPARRAEATAGRLEEGRRESRAVVAAAEREAARIAEHSAGAMPELVAEVLDAVWRIDVGGP